MPRKPSTGSNLVDMGRVCSGVAAVWSGGQLRSRTADAGGEATVKVCGVTVAMLPGLSWAPHSSIGTQRTWEPSAVALPSGQPVRSGAGPSSADGRRWDGGLVVVRAEESSVHGEGGQQVSSKDTGMPGGRW